MEIKADRKLSRCHLDAPIPEKDGSQTDQDSYDACLSSVGGGRITTFVCDTCKKGLKVYRDGHRDQCQQCETEFYLQERSEWEQMRVQSMQPGPTLSERTDALLRGLELLLYHHRMDFGLFVDLRRQIRIHLNVNTREDVWLEKVKHLLASPLADYLKCEAPSTKEQPFKAQGRVSRWLKNRSLVFNRRNTHLWFSWFQIKRCALECSRDFVEQTYKDHQVALTSPDQGDDIVINAILSNRTFKRVLKQTAVGIEKKLNKSKPWTGTTPSKNACFERSRSKGGQQYELRSLAGLQVKDRNTELYSMVLIPHLNVKKGIHHNVVVEIRAAYGSEEWRSLEDLTYICERASAAVQIVLEPLKGRVISKGDALLYSQMRPIQKAMHKTLRRMPCFRLIGRTLSPTDLIDLVLDENRRDGTGWLSIDYKAATDGLSWKYSSRILEAVLSRLSPETRDLAFKCLGPHDLYYPDSDEIGTDLRHFGGTQVSGQLMGSILSFPILCLANLGVYLYNMAVVQFRWSHEKRLSSVLINGDDMLYVGTKTDYTRHAALSGRVGLKMSVGKAYWHPVYANVNSESFHFNFHVKGSTPWKIPFLNTGLFFGAHKVQRSEATAAVHGNFDQTLVGNLNLILAGTLPGRQSEILSRFISTHSAEIKKETYFQVDNKGYNSRNLFLPQSLGGMGVIPPLGYKYSMTTAQLRLAGLINDYYPSLTKVTESPYMEGYVVPKVELELDVPWYKRFGLKKDEIVRINGLLDHKTVSKHFCRHSSFSMQFFASEAGHFIA